MTELEQKVFSEERRRVGEKIFAVAKFDLAGHDAVIIDHARSIHELSVLLRGSKLVLNFLPSDC
jgi:hypothetical protein